MKCITHPSQVIKVENHWIKPCEAKNKQSHCWIVHNLSRWRCTENFSAEVRGGKIAAKFCFFCFFSVASVNYVSCEFEHLLLQNTPEPIFRSSLSSCRLRSPPSIKTALIFNSSSSPRIFAVTVIPRPGPLRLKPSVAGSLSQREQSQGWAGKTLNPFFSHICVFQSEHSL